MALSTLSTINLGELFRVATYLEPVISCIYRYFFMTKTNTAKGAIAIVLSTQWATACFVIAIAIVLLALLHPETRKGLVAVVASALTGASAAVAFFSPSTSIANSANAFAWAGGTAEAIKDGIAIAIGEGAMATVVNDVVLAISPAVASGLTVGGIIGLMLYLVCRLSTICSTDCKTANE